MDEFQMEKHSWDRVKFIVAEKGVPINAEWLDYSVLNQSLESGRVDVAKLVLEKECRVNKEPYVPHNTPLHHAVLLEDVELANTLLEKGASVIALNSAGNSPLHLAFKHRQDQIVDLILNHISQTSEYTNVKNHQGLSHLHIVCTRKDKKLVQEFLDAGADVKDAVDKDSPLWPGFTAMHFAVEFGSLNAAKVIRKAKGDNLRDANHRTPSQLSFEKVQETSIVAHVLSLENSHRIFVPSFFGSEAQFLDIGYYSYPSYFHYACTRPYPDVVEEFIENGAVIDSPVSECANLCPLYTPLHFAVESNCEENVEILLKSGVDTSMKNKDHMTALHLALYNENLSQKTEIVDLLYQAMQNKEEFYEDKNGLTFMHIACTRNDVGLVKHFLDKCQSVNSRIQHNLRQFSLYTPLHFAARYRAFEVAKLLVEYKANVNVHANGESGTPLHLACEMGHAGIIELLLKNGAKANVLRPKDRKTPIHLLVESYIDQREARQAVEHFDLDGFSDMQTAKAVLLDCIEKLVEQGAHINAKDNNNNTALHTACSDYWNGAECAKVLLDFGADVNLEDAGNLTALNEALITCHDHNKGDLATLYHHVQKLKALGLKVSPKNEEFCQDFLNDKEEWTDMFDEVKDEALEKMEKQRQEEICKMKNLMIDSQNKFSLFTFIVSDVKGLKKFAQNNVVKTIAESENLMDDYPSFGFLIKLQYQKAVKSLETNSKSGKKRAANNEPLDDQTKRDRLE